MVMCTDKFQDFVFSLSLKSTGEGATTVFRVNAIRYFSNLYLKSPILGLGYLDGNNGLASGGGHIADIGLLQTIFTTGLSGILYIGVIAVYSLKRLAEVLFTKKDPERKKLVVPLVIAFWIFNLNMDLFSGYLVYSLPIYLACINGKSTENTDA